MTPIPEPIDNTGRVIEHLEDRVQVAGVPQVLHPRSDRFYKAEFVGEMKGLVGKRGREGRRGESQIGLLETVEFEVDRGIDVFHNILYYIR